MNNQNPTFPEPKGMFVYFSQLLDKPVIDKNNSVVGELYDIIVAPGEVYPQSKGLVIRKGFPNRTYAMLPWSEVAEIGLAEIRITQEEKRIVFSQIRNNKEELTLRRDILDQQVVDTYNHKVIRVNDIHLLHVENLLMAAHVDISSRGLMRRLGFEKSIDACVRLVNKNAEYLKTEHLLSWKYIQPLSINPVSMTIKVNFPQKQLTKIPAADLAEIFLDLSKKHEIPFFKSLDLASRARIFMNVDFKTQKSLIEELDPKEGVEILSSIPSDEATDFLEQLPRETANRLLNLMESKQAKKLSELLGYSSDSAGGLMTTEFMSFPKEATVETVLKQIRERSFKVEPAQFVYIVDDLGRLIGSTNFRRLILASTQEAIEKTAFPKTYFVHLESSVKEVAYLMDKYKYYCVPVVDENKTMKGIITVDDVLSQVIAIAWRRLKSIKAKKGP